MLILSRTPRILCMCQAANSRSVALAWWLKNEGCDAVCIGHGTAGQQLKELLWPWAERIVVMEAHMAQYVPDEWRGKVLVCEVGPDRWVNPTHPELVALVRKWIKEGFR